MTAESTVNDLISDARGFAQDSYDQASDLISAAQSAANGFVTITPRELNFSATPIEGVDDIDQPEDFADGFTKPSGKPTSPDIVALHLPEIPVFDAAPDALDTSDFFQFDRPVFDVAGLTASRPTIDTDVAFPTAPTLREYAEPETTQLDLRDTPTATPPAFDSAQVNIRRAGDVPDAVTSYQSRLNDVVPQLRDWVNTYADSWITQYAPEYHTAMATLEAKIAAGFDGNTALPDDVEQQIYDRGVSRAEDERVRLDMEASETFARRGYSLPPPALAAQLARNREMVARASAGVARDVAIQRAELEHQHVQFVMQVSASMRDALRGQVLSYAGLLVNINGQALQDSQVVATLTNEAYRLMMERTRVDLDHLRTLAGIYETQLKSAMADLEIFKVEMEAAKLKKDTELADVAVWEKKIDAQNTRINLYLAELRGVVEKIGVEKVKVDLFGEEVRAYTAQVQGKTAEFNAYRAAIEGDQARVQAHAEEVRAYGISVDAKRTKVQAESAVTEAGAQYNRNLIDVFRADLDSWTKELDSEDKRFSSAAEAYRTRLERYKVLIDSHLNIQRTQYDADRLDLQALTSKLDADVKTLLAQAQLFQDRLRLSAQTAMSGASAFGDMAASAVSAQNTMVNLVNETLN